MSRYEEAKKMYASLGIDTEKALETLKKFIDEDLEGK